MLSDIAKLIDVSKSMVSMEIRRDSNIYRHYVAIDAQQFSDIRKHITRRIRADNALWVEIVSLLRRHRSQTLLSLSCDAAERTACRLRGYTIRARVSIDE